MQDDDRGTYSPPTEDHLDFERQGRASQADQVPLTLIISGIVLVILLVVVVLLYSSGHSNPNRGVDEVGNPLGAYKDSKTDEAQPIKEDSLLDEVGGEAEDTSVPPKLAAVTEKPVDRQDVTIINAAPNVVAPTNLTIPSQGEKPQGVEPAPKSATASTTTPATKPNAALPAEVASALTPKPITSSAPKLKPATTATMPNVTKASAVAAKPVAVKPASPSTPTSPSTPASTSNSGQASVQIGAFASQEIANKQYANTTTGFGGFLAGTVKHVEKVETNGNTLYRTTVKGFASKEKAKAFCEALKASGRSCFVK